MIALLELFVVDLAEKRNVAINPDFISSIEVRETGVGTFLDIHMNTGRVYRYASSIISFFDAVYDEKNRVGLTPYEKGQKIFWEASLNAARFLAENPKPSPTEEELKPWR